MEKLEKLIINNLSLFRPLHVSKIITSLIYRYDLNSNKELLDKLLDYTMQEGFIKRKAEDVTLENDSKKTIDIGILALTFFQHCMILQDKSIDFIKCNMLPLIEQIIEEKTQGTENQVYNDPGLNIKYNLRGNHVNQFLQGLLVLKHVKKLDREIEEIDKLISKLTKLYYFFESYKDFENLSHFQSEVYTCLKKKIFLNHSIKKELQIPPFQLDFLVEEENLVVECQGRQHYLYDGKTLKFNEKRREEILQALGYQVLMIPIQEWRQLHVEDREKYIEKSLQEINAKKEK